MLFMNLINKIFNKRLNKSFLFKIVITFLILSEATAISIVYITSRNYLNNSRNSALYQVNSSRLEKELQLQKWITDEQNKSLNIVNALDVKPRISDITKGKTNEADYAKAITELTNKSKEFIEKDPQIESIFISDNTDKVLMSVDNQRRDISKTLNQGINQFSDLFKKLENTGTSNENTSKNNIKTSYFYLAIKETKPIIVFVNPIFDEFGNRLTNILVNLNFDQIDKIFVSDSDPNNLTYLIGIWDNKPYLIARKLQQPQEENRLLSSVGIQNALKGQQGASEYQNHTGQNVFGSYKWIESLNIALISEIDQTAALASADRLFRDMALIATGIVLLMTSICYALVRYRIQSILEITDVAISVAYGNLEARFPANQQDEIGALAIAFNNMLNRFKYLNQQIKETNHVFTKQFDQSTEVLQNFVELTNEGFAFIDRNNLILQINSNLAEILSISVSEAIGSVYADLFPIELSDLIKSRQSHSRESSTIEFSVPYQSTYRVTVSNIFHKATNNLEQEQFLGTVIVVCESIKLTLPPYDLLSQPTPEIDISRQVSHKIRKPMTSLLSFLKFTQKKLEDTVFPKLSSTDDNTQHTIRQISSNLEVMISEGTEIAKSIGNIFPDETSNNNQLLNDLLEKSSTFACSKLLEQVNLEVGLLCQQKSNKLIFDIDINSTEIQGSYEEIKYVLVNLLTRIANLNEFKVAIFHAKIVNNQVVCVIGKLNSLLTNDQMSSIVNRLYKSFGKSGHRVMPSRGTGLSNLQGILEKYDGSISVEWVDSIRERYKFYILTLPIKVIVE